MSAPAVAGPVELRHLPTVVPSYQYDGTNAADIVAWVLTLGGHAWLLEGELIIETRSGKHTAQVGDWVTRDTRGRFYPIDDDVKNDCYVVVAPAEKSA